MSILRARRVEAYQALRTQSSTSTPNRHSLRYTKNQVQFKSILAILGIKQVNMVLEAILFPIYGRLNLYIYQKWKKKQ